ncbi:hypothetical protein CF327_g1632 [Tilletia walkeri]|uniref:Uncharacterized protein n=1 Tax=Tilletia walkeri TaxID=117179 RepID=A0A8X7T728_9BASI|nr:hypothetical protein CF327_g1632 [Tilletia walkeri]KAE8271332.1 hypothetical protein A4X09_0g995 [Tilletia walkeri]
MKFIGAATVLALSASLVAAEPIVHATAAPAKRQALPTDFSQYSDPNVLSSYYAQATSALDQAASAGAPSSILGPQRSSLDAAFSSAFAALSKAGKTGSSTAASTTSGSGGGNKGAASPALSFDLPVSLALTGVAGLFAAVLAL